MITPAYAVTATERVLPRLALDFTTALLDPRVSVSRALNTATVTNANGSVTIVNANLPRFDYANGVCKGLLIEETRENLLINSILSGAVAGAPGTAPTSWSFLISTGQIKSVSASAYAAGNKITFLASNQRIGLSQNYTLAANTTYVLSAWIDVVSGTRPVIQYLYFASPPAGSTFTYYIDGVVNTGNVPSGRHYIQTVISVSATGGVASPSFGIGIAGNSTAEVSIEMPQLEIGAFATSYIPTTTTRLTRNADDVSMTGTNFSDWYNATRGTFFAQYTNGVAGNFILSAVNSATPTAEAMYVRYSAGQQQIVVVTGSSTVANVFDGTGLNAVSNVKTVFSYQANNYGVRTNGGASSTSAANAASGALPSGINKLNIGANQAGTAAFLNQCVAKLFYYDVAMLNPQLAATSK